MSKKKHRFCAESFKSDSDMYSSVMNAVIKLLLSQGNKINCLGGRELPEKVNTDVLALVLGFSVLNFCLGIRLLEVPFATRKVFGDSFE